MVSHRVGRLAGEIQKEIALIINREIKDPRLEQLSVVSVDIAPDGCSAKIYLSPMAGNPHQREEIIAGLNKAKGYIRRELGKRLKTRAVPELYFHVDQSIAYGIKMMRIIDEQLEKDARAAEGRPQQQEGIYKE